ncbi:MAG TPA: YciI family protein [Thermohalobaculum sp.]|nr:YciI family protein [Thermohalobaculum sp.]
MLYVLICIDKPGAAGIRQANRKAHLEHLRMAGEAIVQAGPFLDDAGEMCGSMIVYAAANRGEAERWLRDDPYEKADLFESVTIRSWRRTVG